MMALPFFLSHFLMMGPLDVALPHKTLKCIFFQCVSPFWQMALTL
jgi:hypothetical protein